MACGIACLTNTHVSGSFNRDSPTLASLWEAPVCYRRETERETQRALCRVVITFKAVSVGGRGG